MIPSTHATEYAKRIGADQRLTISEQRIVELLLTSGPSVPVARDQFCAPESKSGEVILGRLRKKFEARAWVIETCFPNGVRIADPLEVRKQRDKADGYALSATTFASMLDAAEQLPPTDALGASV